MTDIDAKEAQLEKLLAQEIILTTAIADGNLLKQETQDLKREANSLVNEIQSLLNSDVFQELNHLSNDLKILKIAAAYSHKVAEMFSLREHSIAYLERSDFVNSIKTFEKFQININSVKKLKEMEQFREVEAAVGFFSKHCEETINHTFEAINSKLTQKMLGYLKDMNWPKLKNNQEISSPFRDTFLMMTKLKVPSSHSRSVLSSFSCLVLYHRTAFKYHFFGKKETNNIERPEIYLAFLHNIIKEQETFLVETLQPILDQAGLKLTALHEFIAALNELIFEKLEKDKSMIKSSPRLFLHTLEQLLDYDNTLSEYLYNLNEESSCASFFLTDKSLARQWLEIERSDFDSQLESILSSAYYLEDAHTYTKDDFHQDHRISKSAEYLSTLFIESKKRYIYLPKPFRKALFNTVHKHGFSSYLERLKLPIRKLQTNFYPINERGVAKKEDILNVCFSINSMVYMQSFLWSWSCDPYFMFDEDSEASIFADLIEKYKEISQKSMTAFAEELFLDIRPLFHAYERKTRFDSQNLSDMPSAALLPILSSLVNLRHILQHLSRNSYHATIYKFSSLIDEHIFLKVLQKGNLTIEFIPQFKVDLAALQSSLSSEKKTLFPQCFTFLES